MCGGIFIKVFAILEAIKALVISRAEYRKLRTGFVSGTDKIMKYLADEPKSNLRSDKSVIDRYCAAFDEANVSGRVTIQATLRMC